MAKAYKGKRRKEGGFMFATDENNDIVHPILRPDIDEEDKKMYEEIAATLDIDSTLQNGQSYLELMTYNQICYLKLQAEQKS